MAETFGDRSVVKNNAFSNDGSFLEKFKKMQEQKEQEEKPKSSSVKLPPLLTPGKKILTKRKGFLPTQTSMAASVKTESTDEKPPDVKKSKEAPPTSSTIQETITVKTPSATINPSQSTSSTGEPTATPTQKRKRKSRWGEAPSKEDQQLAAAIGSFAQPPVVQGRQQLSVEQQLQLLEQQEMNRLVQQVQNAANQRRGGSKGGVHVEDKAMEAWEKEHKQRAQEMEKTVDKAAELTDSAKGKHFIGDFLPPDELAKFMEKVKAIKEGRNPDISDYAEHKIEGDNLGYKLLQKAGWKEGTGLGKDKEGITAPINKGKQSFDQSGLGTNPIGDVTNDDDQFEVYRKRMMLAYKFRPNPLNNPRRPYY